MPTAFVSLAGLLTAYISFIQFIVSTKSAFLCLTVIGLTLCLYSTFFIAYRP